MRKLLFSLVLMIGLLPLGTKSNSYNLSYNVKDHGVNIPDGWYNVSVDYYNLSTNTRAANNLKVKVTYGSVSVTDFGNGRSVHTGYNNEGYSYLGCFLNYQYTTNGEIVSASATVKVTDSNGSRTYDTTIS